MTARFILGTLARAGGFAAGWAVFTLALLVATRPMGLGPGFSRPLPYAIAAIIISLSGHLIQRWLNEGALPAAPANQGLFRYIYRQKLRGLALFFKGTAGFNNFIFLSIAYFIGIGLTSLFMRKESSGKPGSRPAAKKSVPAAATGVDPTMPSSYWRDLHVGKQDADAYYRPY
ncbi:MAG: hypothetical protein ABIW76_23070 [Fibrobacteria bacterium]